MLLMFAFKWKMWLFLALTLKKMIFSFNLPNPNWDWLRFFHFDESEPQHWNCAWISLPAWIFADWEQQNDLLCVNFMGRRNSVLRKNGFVRRNSQNSERNRKLFWRAPIFGSPGRNSMQFNQSKFNKNFRINLLIRWPMERFDANLQRFRRKL